MDKDRLNRKIDETLAIQRRRRDRRHPVLEGLGGTHRTGEPFAARLFSDERYDRLTEQPNPPMDPDAPPAPEAPPTKDVLVDPDGKTPVPGVDVPEEPELEPEEPEEENPESQIEEQKRALFNTLSELIDMGMIDRNEASIRAYVEDHQDEIGDMLDVLDDVLDMIIVQGDITREPKTFDVEPTPGQKDYDELKPAVGSQVSTGASYTSMIASDQTPVVGSRLAERVIAGEDIESVLGVKEEVIELTFGSSQDRDQALERMQAVPVPTSNLAKVEDTKLQIVRDDNNRADVEQQMAQLENIKFQQSVVEATEPDDVDAMTEQWATIAYSQGDEANEILDIIEDQGPEAALDFLAEMGYTDLEPSEELSNDAPWGDEDEVFYDKATGLTLSWNSRLGYWAIQRKIGGNVTEAKKTNALVPSEREKECPHRDTNTGVSYGRWTGEIPNTGEFKCSMCGTRLDPKTRKSVDESVRSHGAISSGWQFMFVADTPDEASAFAEALIGRGGTMLDNDTIRIDSQNPRIVWVHTRGNANLFTTEKAEVAAEKLAAKFGGPGMRVESVRESINEQISVSRTGLAVQVTFRNDDQASAARGALLQYKGIDTVVEADKHNIVVFTTDTDPEEARKRVEVILNNARIPIESTQMDVYEPIVEAGEEPIAQRYGGADVLPTPVPVAHGQSGADEDGDDDDYMPPRARRRAKRRNAAGPIMGGMDEQAGPVASPEEQKYLVPFHAPGGVEPSMDAGIDDEIAPEGEPLDDISGGPLWRMDVPADPDELTQLEATLDAAKDQGLIVDWSLVPSETDTDLEEPESEPGMAPEPEPNIVAEAADELGIEDEPVDLEPMPGDVGEFIVVEFVPETSPEEREGFAGWIAAETADEATGEPGIQVSGWSELEGGDPGESESLDLTGEPDDQLVEPSPEALAHGPTPEPMVEPAEEAAPDIDWGGAVRDTQDRKEISHGQQFRHDTQALSRNKPNISWDAPQGEEPEDDIFKEQSDDEDDEGGGGSLPPEPDVPADPFDRPYDQVIQQTVGAEECDMPGSKIRSQGRGRGLARGAGRGPMGRPTGA